MKTVTKLVVLFLAITGASTILINLFDVRLGFENFWDNHGLFLLIFITLFPRLTLLLSSIPFGGFFWWLGFLFAPRFLISILATIFYWNQNPILVLASWLVAIGGESGEKYWVTKRTVYHYKQRVGDRKEVFEADFKRRP
ncbi:MAG: hypothetical protein DRQ88_06920 [Epsilonproteobacteria bacterium]|nr:MAG: hypothetical protein DRQ89_05670 [Campylobacterota bacterium]RLA66367.1 MAG: hypothetical protein DRQ88_06920 [Campylobacterota bacterium]